MPKVLKIRDTVMECMRNPFASTVAAEKLLGLDVIAHARSTDAEKIISPKILTFAGQQKQTKKRQDSVKQIVSEEGTVTRALCFTRDLKPLAKNDKAGYKMRKGNKADFLDTLQNKVSETWKLLEELPPSALTPVYVIDAMTSVQRFQTLGQIQPTSGKIQRQDYENETSMSKFSLISSNAFGLIKKAAPISGPYSVRIRSRTGFNLVAGLGPDLIAGTGCRTRAGPGLPDSGRTCLPDSGRDLVAGLGPTWLPDSGRTWLPDSGQTLTRLPDLWPDSDRTQAGLGPDLGRTRSGLGPGPGLWAGLVPDSGRIR
ncbi:hypothetical protein GQR58_014058 [Nymphon striatum]|nr:hypothetical protein GQR58_014058 [Nymphon striatum]